MNELGGCRVVFHRVQIYCGRFHRNCRPVLGKILVIAIFIAILASLGSALVFMVKDRGQSDRTAKALTLRIGVSVCLFILLFILWWLGIITPHGLQR